MWKQTLVKIMEYNFTEKVIVAFDLQFPLSWFVSVVVWNEKH